MSKEIVIYVNGDAYPCRLTMGAMLRFREVTGHEVSEYDGSVRDMCAFIWGCVVSSARRAGKALDMSFMDFCDLADPNEISESWARLQAEAGGETEPDGEKKSQPGY